MSKEVVVSLVLGIIVIAAFLWLRNYWLDYRSQRRFEEFQNNMKKENDEWKKNFIKKNGREPTLGEYLDRAGAPKLKGMK